MQVFRSETVEQTDLATLVRVKPEGIAAIWSGLKDFARRKPIAAVGGAIVLFAILVAIFAGVRGYLDSIKVADVTRFEESLIDEMRARGADILEAIRTEEEISKATEDKLAKFLDRFVKTFA